MGKDGWWSARRWAGCTARVRALSPVMVPLCPFNLHLLAASVFGALQCCLPATLHWQYANVCREHLVRANLSELAKHLCSCQLSTCIACTCVHATCRCREDLFRAYVAELSKAEERQQEREAKQRDAERRLEAERRAADARRQQVWWVGPGCVGGGHWGRQAGRQAVAVRAGGT